MLVPARSPNLVHTVPPTPRFPAFVRLIWLSIAVANLAVHAADNVTYHPLSPRSQPGGETLFTTLSPDATGVHTTNDYTDPRMWGDRYHEFEIGAIGTGVTIGDYDGDGRPDIFVVSKTESSRLFRNLGNFKFEDVTNAAGVAGTGADAIVWKQGASFADINNDGWLDLYVCRLGAPNLLYVNQGNGTFREAAAAHGLAIVDGSSMAAFADYDRDGWLDLYLHTNLLDNQTHPAGQPDYLLHNNGDGSFTDVSVAAGISRADTQANSATWWDFDEDGWPDLYVANDFAVPDFFYRNNGDGTFTNIIDTAVPHLPYSSMGGDIGDIDGDGRLDFIVADMAASTHSKDQRTMAETRSRTDDPPAGDRAPPNYLHNAVYLNTGTPRFFEAAFLTGLAATDWTWAVRFEDLDNDGRVDVFVTNGMHREIHNTDLLQRMMTSERANERVRIAKSSPVLEEANLAYRNRGDLRFERTEQPWGLDQRGVSFGAAFGDLDGDGDLDLVYTNYLAGASVLRNDSTTGHRLLLNLRGRDSNHFGVGARVRLTTASGVQVRELVLARGSMSASEPVVHFGLGTDERIEKLEVFWPSGRHQILHDVAVDQRLTITEPTGSATVDPTAPPSPQFVEVGAAHNLRWTAREPIVDEIAQQRLLPTRFNRLGPGLAVADLTGDGRDDVFIGGTSLDPARILIGAADQPFIALEGLDTGKGFGVNDGPLLVFDANGDGRNDLLVTKGGSSQPAGAPEYQPVLLHNVGSGLKPAPADTLPSLPISVGAVAAADFDRNGLLDLFVGARVLPGYYPATPRSALLQNHHGRFIDVTDQVAPALREVGLVTSALWSDVDADGWSDLLVTVEWGHVKYFHNDAGQGFTDRTAPSGFAAAGTGWWNSISTADFNGDGRLDYLVGNAGLNTRYHASPDEPAVLYFGAFGGDGPELVIEGYYENGKLYPRRSRRELGAAIPEIRRKYRRNDYYANATLDVIVGAEALQDAEKFVATELRSGVLLSNAAGTYTFHPLPRLAQIAPVFGQAVADFNGDGHTDVAVVTNSFAPDPIMSRFDGGLGWILSGDGAGNFSPADPATSGFVVPRDAKALAPIDFNADGWPDLIATRNNDASLAFRNQGVEGGNVLRVRLAGGPGNPDGVGAVIQLTLADGSIQMAEVSAGSGYRSQSTGGVYFGYPSDNPARSIEVRWPDGTSSTHQPTAGQASMTLPFPSRP
ncbi:FG-GAP-like repeat-containing protein [Synoicihabitans lomoniglobus]|uniref:FG-GAP-like repeat-containing protein n=1 Tax=Synoicihabitans lomoniglobus TaxID=2909285 RepID=A0AAF0CG65_9BACT|nr:FG-GAP-like repeat-containing protein [Opitutaceae bacterium LMO-M01]WED63227.1 FG-GAP-like repeat-containing protein [Opitutaceae bacterium LMO-M01]